MFFRNLLYTLRNFKNQKLFAIVNLTGLTTGIVAASFILIYIGYELSFDRFNKNAENIYRVYGSYTIEGKTQSWVQTPAPLAAFLQNKFPVITRTVRITKINKGLLSSGEKNFFEERLIMADSSLFEVFTFPLKTGDPHYVLAQPNSIVISESTAEKYFGKSNPVGKNLRYNRAIDLTVTGIMKDIPGNTHLHFDMVISMSGARSFFGTDFFENRMNTVASVYLLTTAGTDPVKLEKSVSQSTKEYNEGGDFGDNKLYHIQPLTSIHLFSDMGGEFEANNDIKGIYILGTIAFLILVIACINYINLSFSLNSRRTPGLGMRRIMGASRVNLVCMYLSDASFLTGIAVILSAFFIGDQQSWFNRLTGINSANYYSLSNIIPGLFLFFLLITTATGLISGWVASRVSPMEALKKSQVQIKGEIGRQGILVLFQFGISVVLISSTLFIYRQMRFIQNQNLGLSKDQLMIIPLNDKLMSLKLISFRQELLKNPNILSVSATSDLPGEMKWITSIDYEGSNNQIPMTMAFLEIDKEFVTTYGVQLREGYLPGDTSCPYTGVPYLLNEAAARKLGWDKPLGKQFSLYNVKNGFVSGIIKDFHFKSLHEKIEPLFLYVRDGNYNYLAVKLNTFGISASVDYIKKLWTRLAPDSPFEYFFYDNYYNQLYKKEALFGKIILIFSTIAILIACMGLFGLAAFYSEQRTKEIGLRKVSGATVSEIMMMLNIKFVKWVLLAFIVATPVAWYAMHKWLQSFSYRIDLSWWIFVASGLIVLVVALLTVSWQSWRAATRNPVEALRYE